MAFAGMLIVFFVIVLIIAALMLILSIVLLIVGIVRHNQKKSGKVCFIVSGVLFALVISPMIIFSLPVKVDVDTPDGKSFVWSNRKDAYFEAINQGDTKSVDRLLDKDPKLIYVIRHGDNIDGLHAAIIKNDIETAECIIKHGGAFDSGYNFAENEYTYSLECYFDTYYRRKDLTNVGHNDYECIKFIIDNNAKLDYDDFGRTPLFDAVSEICCDGTVTDEEADTVNLMIESGVDTNYVTPDSGETVLDYFLSEAERNQTSVDDIKKIEPILRENVHDNFPVSPEFKEWLVESEFWGDYNNDPEMRKELDESWEWFISD